MSGFHNSISNMEGQLDILNERLSKLPPTEILQWSVRSIPHLFQISAFGLTGMVILDILSKLSMQEEDLPTIGLIFIDTLFHFQETLELIERVKVKYPHVNIHIYKPKDTSNVAEFEEKYGCRLWESEIDLYDHTVKIEPVTRAYAELSVHAVLTGRRRSQGDQRSDLKVIEIDPQGLIKINPLVHWSLAQVEDYITTHSVPYNALLDRGYKSVGDWHSTQPTKSGEGERTGRWAGQEKTECGIHFRSPASTSTSDDGSSDDGNVIVSGTVESVSA